MLTVSLIRELLNWRRTIVAAWPSSPRLPSPSTGPPQYAVAVAPAWDGPYTRVGATPLFGEDELKDSAMKGGADAGPSSERDAASHPQPPQPTGSPKRSRSGRPTIPSSALRHAE